MVATITQMLVSGQSDLMWFESRFNEIITKYNNQFIAFHDKEILDSASDLDSLLKRLERKGINASEVLIKFVSRIKAILLFSYGRHKRENNTTSK